MRNYICFRPEGWCYIRKGSSTVVMSSFQPITSVSSPPYIRKGSSNVIMSSFQPITSVSSPPYIRKGSSTVVMSSFQPITHLSPSRPYIRKGTSTVVMSSFQPITHVSSPPYMKLPGRRFAKRKSERQVLDPSHKYRVACSRSRFLHLQEVATALHFCFVHDRRGNRV